MAQFFNADEIFNIGVQIEKNGRAFYLAAKDRTKDPVLKNLFIELAKWEGNHVELFEHLRSSLSSGVTKQIDFDSENMIHLYLKSVADNQIFTGQSIEIDTCKTPLDILKKALDFERDSVVLYSSMKEIVPLNLGKQDIDKLVIEELKHVGQLTAQIAKLKSIT